MELEYALSRSGGGRSTPLLLRKSSSGSSVLAARPLLDDVVIELFNQFGLKEATVRTYAASPAFVVTDGRIRLRREDETVEVNDRIASAPGLYLRPTVAWCFTSPVDADVLRGSGRSIPNPLSVAVGVRPGGAQDFSAGDLGRVRVSWSATAVTGAAHRVDTCDRRALSAPSSVTCCDSCSIRRQRPLMGRWCLGRHCRLSPD